MKENEILYLQTDVGHKINSQKALAGEKKKTEKFLFIFFKKIEILKTIIGSLLEIQNTKCILHIYSLIVEILEN